MRLLTLSSVVLLWAGSLVAGQSWTVSIPNRAVYSICADPQDPRTLYAGNMARIFFKSTDGGITWEERAIGSTGGFSTIQLMAVHPRKSNIVFAGGQGMSGLARSTDAGGTWATVLDTPDGFRFEMGGSGALAFDPLHPDTMYVVRFMFGEVYRSADAGENWEKISTLPDLETSDNMRALTVCPDSSNVLMLSGRKPYIYRSTDYGKTWTVAQKLTTFRDTDVANFAWSPSIKGTVYATAQMTLFYNVGNAGLFKSTDYGLNWQHIALIDTSVYPILIHPTKHGDELFIGGCQFEFPPDNGAIRGDSIVLRSNGNDTTFMDISDVPWTDNEQGVTGYNVYGFAVTQRDSLPVVLMASDGGVFQSNTITSVNSEHAPAPLLQLRIVAHGFVIPEVMKGACQYVVSDILGSVRQQGSSEANATVSVQPLNGQPVFVTVTDGRHVARCMMVP